MQIENDYEKKLYNGDVGAIEDVDIDASELTVRFDGRAVTMASVNSIRRCWLIPRPFTSQGSEYPAVVIPVLTQHYPMSAESFRASPGPFWLSPTQPPFSQLPSEDPRSLLAMGAFGPLAFCFSLADFALSRASSAGRGST